MVNAVQEEVFEGRYQFQGVYEKVWLCKGLANPPAVTGGGDQLNFIDFDVAGVKRGDHVISYGAWPSDGVTGSISSSEILWTWVVNENDKVKGLYAIGESAGTRDLVELIFTFVVGRPALWNISDQT
jgi:hypothetical protein